MERMQWVYYAHGIAGAPPDLDRPAPSFSMREKEEGNANI